MPPSLDHIIVLVAYNQLLSPPAWLTDNFTITPGGRHADNKTENKLICFQDGSYIELIAFINDDPALKKGHWWGQKEYGIIDFAFTTEGETASQNYENVKKQLEGLEVSYQEPKAGGRKRDDGVDVKWEVTFPVGAQRGEIPFYCHDITAREVRVPGARRNVTHPSGVYGVKQLEVFVPGERASVLGEASAAVIGNEKGAEPGTFKTRPLKGEGGGVIFGVKEPSQRGKRWRRGKGCFWGVWCLGRIMMGLGI